MRSATVVGIVAGGGIGVFVLETIRMGAYQQYAAALWIVAIVIILVDNISARWRESILKDQPQAQAKRGKFSIALRWLLILIGIAAFVYLWNIAEINLTDLFNPGPTFGRLISDFVSIDLSSDVVNDGLEPDDHHRSSSIAGDDPGSDDCITVQFPCCEEPGREKSVFSLALLHYPVSV